MTLHTKSNATIAGRAAMLLLAALYLGAFIAHDIVFIPHHHHGGEEEISLTPLAADEICGHCDSLEHHCPFCDGFIDSSDVAEAPASAGAACCAVNFRSQPTAFEIWSLCPSRAPPTRI